MATATDGSTPKKRPAFKIGRRFTPADETRLVPGNKLARRILRRRAIQQSSSIEHAIEKARRVNAEASNLATNSHEAKRYLVLARREREEARGS